MSNLNAVSKGFVAWNIDNTYSFKKAEIFDFEQAM